MITYITLNEQRYTFLDYLELTEGIAPRTTEYQFSKDDTNYYGIFESSGKVLCVLTKTARPGWYEVGFGRHLPGRPLEPSPENYTMTEQMPTQKFFDVFGKVLYVTLDICSKHLTDLTRLRFTGGYDAIAKFYKVLMQNKIFVNKLDQYGFELDSKMMDKYGSGIFILKRK